ncbi:PPOX class F420-dependent oxidoreductase [Streptomyces chartreusis]|uniref:PPOX class F420-dependent oxidoreductase n=1 Tax=Streptomyces chartreusis TaxID=1969 RepID=UPI003439B592
MNDTLLEQGACKYMLITSYRKTGTPVSTPVWVVRDGDTLGVRTPADSWKVKRIRGRGDILVGPRDLRGGPTGDPGPGHRRDHRRGHRRPLPLTHRPKYGIVDRLMVLDSWLRGANRTLGIHERLTPHHGHAGACRKHPGQVTGTRQRCRLRRGTGFPPRREARCHCCVPHGRSVALIPVVSVHEPSPSPVTGGPTRPVASRKPEREGTAGPGSSPLEHPPSDLFNGVRKSVRLYDTGRRGRQRGLHEACCPGAWHRCPRRRLCITVRSGLRPSGETEPRREARAVFLGR